MTGEPPSEGFEMLLGLGDKLKSLTDEKFLAVIDKLALMSELSPIAGLIDESRPRLRILKPQRPRSLKRPLCLPFEDLLSLDMTADHGIGAINRGIVEPLWQHLQAREPAVVAALQAECRQIPANRPAQILEMDERLWRLVTKVLAAAPLPGLDEKSSQLLSDLMAAASEIEALKRALPRKPIAHLGDFEKGRIEEQLHVLAEKSLPNQGFLLIVAARLASPAELLNWFRTMDAVMPPVVELFVLGKMTHQIDSFDREAAQLDPEALAAQAHDLIAALAATEEAVGPASRQGLAARTDGIKASLRHALQTKIIDAAPAGVAAILTDAPSREDLFAAEAHARALAKSRKAAGKVGLAGAAESAISSIRRSCVGRIDEVLARASASGSNGPESQAAVFQSVRLVELVDGASSAREILADARRRLAANERAHPRKPA